MIKVLEFQTVPIPVTFIRHFDENLLVGYQNGDLFLINLLSFGVVNFPRTEADSGSVLGIEVLKWQERNLFAVFRENPSFLYLYLDSEEGIQEVARIQFPENSSLLQLIHLEEEVLFVMTLLRTTVSIAVYDPDSQLREVSKLFEEEYTNEEMQSVVNFCIPEKSLFSNMEEDGCDLWVLRNGGSLLEVISISSSQKQTLIEDIHQKSIDTTIFSMPETSERVLGQLLENNFIEELSGDLNLDVVNFLAYESPNLLCDFMLRNLQGVFFMEDVSFIADWVYSEACTIGNYLRDQLKNIFLEICETGADIGSLLEDLGNLRSRLYCLECLEVAAEMRGIQTQSEIPQKVHFLRFMEWVLRNDSVQYLKTPGWSWTTRAQKRAFKAQEAASVFEYSCETLYVEKLTRALPPSIEELFDLIFVLSTDDFQVLMQYILFDLYDFYVKAQQSEASEHLTEIYENYRNYFALKPQLRHKALGFWHLDMLFDEFSQVIDHLNPAL